MARCSSARAGSSPDSPHPTHPEPTVASRQSTQPLGRSRTFVLCDGNGVWRPWTRSLAAQPSRPRPTLPALLQAALASC